MKKVFFVLVSVFLILTAGPALADDIQDNPTDPSYNPYDKDYAVSFHWGRTRLENSDFKEYWDLDDTYDGFAISVERKYGKSAAIELSGGVGKYEKKVHDVFVFDDTVSATIKGYYLSLTPKEYIQMSNDATLYVGGGPDYYSIDIDLDYDSFVYSDGFTDSFNVLGLHALAGVDVILLQNPWSKGDFDAPVSLLIEYQYSWVHISEADKKIIDSINANLLANEEYHDLNMGGHTLNIGLRWRF